jgi:hypothetical protein
MRCPYVYNDGKQCDGYVDDMKWVKANVSARLDEKGEVTDVDWKSDCRIQLHCSKKGTHAARSRTHQDPMSIVEVPKDILDQVDFRKLKEETRRLEYYLSEQREKTRRAFWAGGGGYTGGYAW